MDGKELNLDLNCEISVVAPKIISGVEDDVSLKLSKLLQDLEDESRKIGAFKRELPLSMHIITNAIEKVKDEVLKMKEKEERPAMEFLPLKGNFEERVGAKRSNDQIDKKNWLDSATLWNNPVDYDLPRKSSDEKGAFEPYKRKAMVKTEELDNSALPIRRLSEFTPAAARGNGSKKQRRCWSPELHQRFVNALNKLGGAQAATPKQIIDVMRVDGLTNDEVKSHLQKYRLHVRRLPTNSPSTLSISPVKMSAQSGSPEGPLHMNSSAKELSMTLTNIPEEDQEEISESNWNGRFGKH